MCGFVLGWLELGFFGGLLMLMVSRLMFFSALKLYLSSELLTFEELMNPSYMSTG